MSKKPNSALKKRNSTDLFADLTISGSSCSTAQQPRSQSAGKSSNTPNLEAAPVPPIQVLDVQDAMEISLPSPIVEDDGEILEMSTSDADFWFDTVIGHIEDLIMDDDFQHLQQSFFDQHCSEFDDSDENKLIYTEIHHSYVETIERFLEMKLRQLIDDFNMVAFIAEVEQRWRAAESSSMSDEEKMALGLDCEVFEMLHSFGDFLCFKEMMLDHKRSKLGQWPDFSQGLQVINMNTPR